MSGFDFTARALALRAQGCPPATFTQLSERSIPQSVDWVQSIGHAAPGSGAAAYVSDALCTPALLAAHPACVLRSLNGRIFRLASEGVLLVEQAGAIGDGMANDQPAIQAAIDYAIATGVPTVGFTAASYALWNPVRTTQSADAHSYDGHCIFVDGSIRLLGLNTDRGGRVRLSYFHTDGSSRHTNVQRVGANLVWRGGGVFLKGHVAEPADFAQRNHLTLENLELDGGFPRTQFASTAWLDATSPSDWDVTDKGLWAENDRYVGHMRLINVKIHRFGGELVYSAGRSSTNGDPDLYMRNCVVADSNGSGLNPSACRTDIECEVENVALGIEGWTGENGRIVASFADCYQAGGLQGGKVNTDSGNYYLPTRYDEAIVPYGQIALKFRNCTGGFQPGWWLEGKILAIDTQVVFGSASFAQRSRNCRLSLDMVTDQVANRAYVVIAGSDVEGEMLTDDLSLDITHTRTKAARDAGRTVTSAVQYYGSLGANISVRFQGDPGTYSFGPAATLRDYAPKFFGDIHWTGWVLGALTHNVETAPAIDKRGPLIRLTTTANSGSHNVQMATGKIAKGTRTLVLNGTTGATIQFSGGVTAPATVSLPPGCLKELVFQNNGWVPA